jgi:hypothetical protein
MITFQNGLEDSLNRTNDLKIVGFSFFYIKYIKKYI